MYLILQPKIEDRLVEIPFEESLRRHGCRDIFTDFFKFSFFGKEVTTDFNSLFLLGEGQSHAHEWVKGDGDSGAVRALDFGAVLTCKVLGNKRLVTFEIVVPAELADNLVRTPITFDVLHVGLCFYFVEVFVQLVKEVV